MVSVYHGFSKHSAIERHLSCFQFGVIINKASMSSLPIDFCEDVFLLGEYLGVKLLDCTAKCMFIRNRIFPK